MNKFFLSFIPVLFFSFYSAVLTEEYYRPGDDCGGIYRWDNKIMIDPKGLSLYKKKPKASTIHTVVNYQKPPNTQLRTNRGTIESKKVTVTAMVIGIGEEEDGDYHLILTSTNYKDSLIAEIPDPSCDKLTNFPGLKDDYRKAREFIEDNVDDNPGGIEYLSEDKVIKVKITGMLFFDKKAHGKGHAKNDIEIHPVLKIVKAD